MTPSDKNHLQIRCPSCSQKFKVGHELMGRMVECGACESRFEVTEDVMAKGEKFYPGERDPAALSQFHRVPGPTIGQSAATPVPRGAPEKNYYSPITRVSAFRIVTGWIGALVILGLACLLPATAPGPLAALPTPLRVMIAIGGGLLGIALLAYANPRTRRRTVPVVVLFSIILLSVPFIFQAKMTATPSAVTKSVIETDSSAAAEEPADSIETLREKIGIAPLEAEIQRLKHTGQDLHAWGIWLRDMNDSNRLSVRDYMIRTSGANPGSIIYVRGNRSYLMVLTGVRKSLEEIAEITRRIALKQQIRPELNLVEVRVDASVFMEGPLDKLLDKGSPAFYDLNKRELESVQLDRAERAVRRLADAEPKIYRKDVTRLLVGLLATDEVNFYGDVAKALLNWAEDPAEASGAALIRLKRLSQNRKSVPSDLVELLAKAKSTEALPIVKSLWLSDVTTWERLFGQFGPVAEPVLLDGFADLDITQTLSAIRLLGAVGTKASLPALETAKGKGNSEMNVLIENAEKAIHSRG